MKNDQNCTKISQKHHQDVENSFLKITKFRQHDGAKFRTRTWKFISKSLQKYVPRSPNWVGRFSYKFHIPLHMIQIISKKIFKRFFMFKFAKNRKRFKIDQKWTFFWRIQFHKKLDMTIPLILYPSKDLIIWNNISIFFKNLPSGSWELDMRKFCLWLRKFFLTLRNFAPSCCQKFVIFKKLFPMIRRYFCEILMHFWVFFVENGLFV